MIKVRTLVPHGNGYPPQWQKNRGRHYHASESDAANLITTGKVEKVEDDADGREDTGAETA